jgi:hypothetical protein
MGMETEHTEMARHFMMSIGFGIFEKDFMIV